MKIAFFERSTVSAGDISLDGFGSLGEVIYLEKPSFDEITGSCGDCDIIICNKTPITRELMSALPSLRLVCVAATGYNNIDTNAAKALGITVCNVPGYSTESVVQTVFSLLLNLAGSLYKYIRSTSDGDWKKSEHFTYFPFRMTELYGKTLGILGYGTIGKRVGEVSSALGMKVVITSRHRKENCPFPQLSLEEMLPLCDFLSLNCQLTDETRMIINEKTLSLMKPTAFIINTSRGPVVDEYAVAEAVKKGVIAGYGSDVLTEEPMSQSCPLYGIDNVILTPHIAWATKESRMRLVDVIKDNILAYNNGKPINVVNR